MFSAETETDPGAPAAAHELRGFLTGFAIVGAVFAPVSIVNVFVLHRTRSIGGLAGVAILLTITLLGRRAIDRGNVRAGLSAAMVALLVSSFGFLAVDPSLAPTLAMMPLLAVALAMPHVERRTFTRLSVGAIAIVAMVLTIGEILPERNDLPAVYQSVIRWSSFVAVLSLVLWLLAQHRRQLVASLGRVQEAEERFRTLVEQMPAVTHVSRADATSSSIYNSPQLVGLLGYPMQTWIDDPELWPKIIHPHDREAVLEANRRNIEEGTPFAMEYRMIAADGRTVWVREQAVRVERPDDEPIVLGVMFDVTDRVAADHERRRLENERRQLISRLVSVQEEERRRIANDIHDDPVQKMAAVGMRLAAFRRSIDDETQLAALGKLEVSVGSAVSRLRHLMFELQPPSLEREGLAGALQEYLTELSDETGIATGLASELDREHEPAMEIRSVVYRIAQEALSNVRKHARADRVDVRLRQVPDGILLEVIDDGAGFDTSAPVGPDHLGLRSMVERAEFVGGWLRVESGSRGTLIRCWVPSEVEGSATGPNLRESARV